MSRLRTAREAKEYLIRRIVEQANQDSIPLSDIERKMLFFSESGWSQPNMMAVSRDFDQAYNQDEYEKKIAQIIRRLQKLPENNEDSWNEAVRLLRTEDHYLSVLIETASDFPKKQSRWEFVGIVVGGLVVIAVWLPVSFLIYSHVENPAIQKLMTGSALLGLALLVAFVGSRGRRRAA